MPTDTPDQQITMPVDADSADNPVAFVSAVADIEQRLVRRYTTEADRTTRMTTLNTNDVSSLTAPTVGRARLESYDGSNHISHYVRGVYNMIRKGADETVNNSVTLQNDDALLVALPTAGRFMFELDLVYQSSTVADFQMAFTVPAGATLTWEGMGLATGAASISGDITMPNVSASGTAGVVGGSGSNSPLWVKGEVTMGGTAGNLQLQWAQQNLEASNTIVRARSRLTIWRFS